MVHYNGLLYLSLIDCGPSRFVVLKCLPSERADYVCESLENLFRERGPPEELLLDNSTVFRSATMHSLAQKWKVYLRFRCAYRPSGNGIVERMHRTIKRMAARSGADILDMVLWWNMSPQNYPISQDSPFNLTYTYEGRNPNMEIPNVDRERSSPYVIGERVFVKPSGARCVDEWPVGTITGIVSNLQIEVDGIPRHVSDLRPVATSVDGASSSSTPEFSTNIFEESDAESDQTDYVDDSGGRPVRNRYPPVRLSDYELVDL